MSHTAHQRSLASSAFLSPEEARARLVRELELEEFDSAAQDELVQAALDALMNEVMIAVFSWIPETDYTKIEKLAEEGRDDDVQAIITKHLAPKKIASIIDGIFTEGVKRYKELLQQNDSR